MKTYPVVGNIVKGLLGVEVNGEEDTTKLIIVTPCCRAYVSWKGSYTVACDGCGMKYKGFTDSVYELKDWGPDVELLKNWLTEWLRIKKADLEVTIT